MSASTRRACRCPPRPSTANDCGSANGRASTRSASCRVRTTCRWSRQLAARRFANPARAGRTARGSRSRASRRFASRSAHSARRRHNCRDATSFVVESPREEETDTRERDEERLHRNSRTRTTAAKSVRRSLCASCYVRQPVWAARLRRFLLKRVRRSNGVNSSKYPPYRNANA